MDDTGLHEYPLIYLNVNRIDVKYEAENGQDNACSFMLKKMGICDHPCMVVACSMNVEANYYNMAVSSYEPLIEPWQLSADINQKTPSSTMNIDLKMLQFMNINLTYGMAMALKKMMNRLAQDATQWENEEALEEARMTQM